jgi:hypothetical protein
MNVDKARKQARFVAFAAILTGASVLLLLLVLHFVLKPTLAQLLQQEPVSKAAVIQLIKLLKGLGFTIPVGLCLALLGSGVCTLNLINKQKTPTNGPTA